MGFPEPPQDGKVTSWLGFAIICLCIAVGYRLFNSLGGKPRKDKDASTPSLSVPTPGDEPSMQISTKGMAPDTAAAFAQVSVSLAAMASQNVGLDGRVAALSQDNEDLAARVASLSKDNEGLGERVKSLEGDNQMLDGRVKKLEAVKRDLIEHIVILRKGIANGTIPPMPDLAKNIQHLFGDLLE